MATKSLVPVMVANPEPDGGHLREAVRLKKESSKAWLACQTQEAADEVTFNWPQERSGKLSTSLLLSLPGEVYAGMLEK